MVDAGWNASSVVNDCHGIIRIDRHFNRITKSRKSFIHRIVHDFVHKVVQVPLAEVLPIYIPGLLRTASNPSKIWI